MKISFFCLFYLVPVNRLSPPLHQENGAIHILYQVQLFSRFFMYFLRF